MFIPHLSKGLSIFDLLTVPNIPLISAIPNVNQLGFLEKFGFKTILGSTKPREFQNLTASKYFNGYNDSFMNLIEKVKWDFKAEDVGILAPRRGVTKKSVTVYSGTGNVYDIGKVVAMDSQDKVKIWKTDRCNQVSGSDGVIYGPSLVQKREVVQVYLPNFCRSLPLVFDKEVKVLNGLRSFKYKAPFGTFSATNEFYCEPQSFKGKHIDGVLDVSGCIDGTPPIFISHPHFMEADPELYKHLDGIKPDENLHSSYAFIHPRLAVPLYGVSRMQLNLKVNHFGNYFRNLPDGIILPLVWIETTNEEIPDFLRKRLFLSTVIVDLLETLIKFASVVCSSVSIFYLTFNSTSSFMGIIKLLRKRF